MRAGRFGSKAGRVAVVAALVLGTLAVWTTAANADESSSTDHTTGMTIGSQAGQSASDVAQALSVDWG